ncbi:GAF domain-containing protein [Mycobacterium sp. ITM-2016-00317]|uniref:GAF domain-containing protein n=1 Tax=Mycobacterium sp. ITM-2016-00317 TaxID=2099694 RepID=UPI00287F5E73|nr:GAF domain-containing protein [Mycobacterium sp. ITM-2016-00317]WNG85459.1 GAF domain-containing protein [Mycobacterium sp. ITM-2016-00317]
MSITTEAPTLPALLRDLADTCIEVLPKADGCGLSMLTTDGRRITSVATDVTGEQLNALHDRYRDNPCAEAWRHAAVVKAATSSTAGRWPQWMTRVHDLGVGSVLTTGLHTAERRIGTVMVFSSEAGAFGAADVASLSVFARTAAARIDALQSGRTGSGTTVLGEAS